MFVNIFLKVLKLQVGYGNLQVGHGVTRGLVVCHPCARLYSIKKKRNFLKGLDYKWIKWAGYLQYLLSQN